MGEEKIGRKKDGTKEREEEGERLKETKQERKGEEGELDRLEEEGRN